MAGRAAAWLLAVCLVLAVALALAAPSPARADEGAQAPDADALAAKVDALVQGAKGGWDVLAVVVTSGGEPVLQRTYRSAGAGTQVQAGGSTEEAFDWGRASDLLIWTAVMQLVQEGSLSLESRVYLRLPDGIELPDGYESLTVLDLMNHASGLNASPRSLAAASGTTGGSVVAALRDYVITASGEPGQVVAYAPTDAALAAAVVEQVSGLTIEEYLRTRVLEPLGATGTTVAVGEPARGAISTPGHDGDTEDVTRGFLENPVVTCVGTAADLALVERGLLGLDPQGGAVLSARGVQTLFTVSRTFPSLGTPRVAHGLFVLPLDDGAFGMAGSTWSGFTTAAYMDPQTGVGVVAIVNQAWREDLVQGVARLAFGTGELDSVIAARDDGDDESAGPDEGTAQAVDASTWEGVYQDASLPEHGPARLLATLQHVFVRATQRADGQAGLTLAGARMAEVGRGVYLSADTSDPDAYRFCVSRTGGPSFARVESDSYAVPLSTLVIEGALLGGLAAAVLACGGYALVGCAQVVRARLTRRRWGGQDACLWLAGLSAASVLWTAACLLYPDTSVAISLFPAARVANAAYLALALALVAWLAVTRWRGTERAPRRLAACLCVMAGALVVMLNLVYWEMLP